MKKALIFSIVVTMLMFIASAIIYPHLPEIIPTHWNAMGVVDGYGGKISIFIFPAISLFMILLLYFLPKFDPKGHNIKNSGKVYPLIMVALVCLMAIISFMVTATSFGMEMPMNTIMPASVGIFILLMSNYMPKVKPNYSFGIRLPWTLANETVWTKTHRFSSKIFFVVGLAFIAGIFIPAPINILLPSGALFVGLGVISVYAYLEYKKIARNEKTS